MLKVTRGTLVDAAKDLNKILDPDPPIDVKLGVPELQEQVLAAANLLKEGDAVKGSTREVVDLLRSGGEDGGEDKGEAAPTTARRSGSSLPNRYEGSSAQRLDNALLKGGKIEKIADDLGMNKGQVKAHAKFRARSGKFSLREDEDGTLKLTKVAA